MNILNNVDGSAKWEQGTSVICSVTGPIETRRRTDEPTLAQVELVIRPAIGQATTRETLIKDRIYSVLAATVVRNLYPRMLLQIVIQILEQGEGTGYNVLKLAACLNAMCLALIDSRTPMTGLFTAVAIAIVDDKLILHPTRKQVSQSTSTHAVSYFVENNKATGLLMCESEGEFTENQLFEVLEQAARACEDVALDMRERIEKGVKEGLRIDAGQE
ncbi:ribosomal protein S5 domain 2-type protein [Yarrowia lipolytica]|uniref:Exosome complex component RRP46 n=1 Tax=Yarrowia lipolytica TaxID=4952 RepID=A0A1D8NP96_YARLL|nr:hypothetical protein YALI1_F26915g [Yarrowia lipolytica]KAB8286517.1 ribosomal protein S5 domain 2-type protein [Yarrowia lipolytica]KAE8173538.1 ribosomal protein S5 domain 2-type protein [Yarrowia lipolytica]KAJ8055466.1 ribosomal protein S5 domain 2-type protein [Yarrowia lipolytica]RMJ00254.1 ribosomal protein S5 domain 2-type protein [Yarrowia lipolytica]